MAIGCRDREANAEMRLDSIFRIASITKPMVSVAATQLTEEGRREPFADRAAIWASEAAASEPCAHCVVSNI